MCMDCIDPSDRRKCTRVDVPVSIQRRIDKYVEASQHPYGGHDNKGLRSEIGTWTNDDLHDGLVNGDKVLSSMAANEIRRRGEIPGASPETPTTTTLGGGIHSLVEADYTQLDGPALAKIAEVMYHGSRKYGRDNWRAISDREHVNHALMHLFADQSGDTQDDHLAHALTRLMFALAVRLRPDHLGEYLPDLEPGNVVGGAGCQVCTHWSSSHEYQGPALARGACKIRYSSGPCVCSGFVH